MGKVSSSFSANGAMADGSSCWVILTASMTKPCSLYSRYIASSDCISARQGGHQVAHKLTSTACPRRSDNLTDSPSSVFNSKSGARKPCCGAGTFPDVEPPDLSALMKIQASPAVRK